MRSETAESEWLKFFLGILLPRGGYVAIFTKSSNDLVAYFDESMSEGRLPMTAVAGYLFERSAYLEFDKGMRQLLRENGMDFFRMQDCLHLRGHFKKFEGMEPKSEQPSKIERDVIRLVREYAVLGVGAAVSEAKYELRQPMLMEEIMGGAY